MSKQTRLTDQLASTVEARLLPASNGWLALTKHSFKPAISAYLEWVDEDATKDATKMGVANVVADVIEEKIDGCVQHRQRQEIASWFDELPE